jgi:ribonuclease G
MNDAKNRRALFNRFKEEMAKDSAKHTVLPPSRFGLVQITRQRVRPLMTVPVLEQCPVCNGSGEIKSSVIVVDDIENNLNSLIQDQNEKNLTLAVHPFIAAYLTKGVKSIRYKWFLKYKRWVKIRENKDFHLLEYLFLNKNNEVIKS